MTPLLSLCLLWTAISYGQSADHNVSVFIRWKNVNVSPRPIRLSVPLPSSGTIINKITYRSCNRNNSRNWPSCFPSSSDLVAGSGDAPPSPHPPECTRAGKEDGLACKSSRTICSPILSNDVLYMFKLSVGNTESEWVPSCDPGLSSPSPSTDAPSHQTKSPHSDSFQFVVWQIILIAIGGTLIMVLLIVGVACCCGCGRRRNRKGFYDVSTPRPTPNVATNDLAYSNASMGPSNGGGSVRGSRASVSRVGTTLSLTSGSGAKTKKKKEFWKDEELSVEVAPIDIIPMNKNFDSFSPLILNENESRTDSARRPNPLAFIGDVELHPINEEDDRFSNARLSTFGFSNEESGPKSFSQAVGIAEQEGSDSGCNSSDLESQGNFDGGMLEEDQAKSDPNMVTSL